MIGHVKWFDSRKGYGFIIEHETKKEYYVMITDIRPKDERRGTLGQGQPVCFELQNDFKGRVCCAKVEALSIEDILNLFKGEEFAKVELMENHEQCFNPVISEALVK